MKLTTSKRHDQGFTLIEVLVALAIVGTALILILSANGTSLRTSVQARMTERLTRTAESKFAEWKAGTERNSQGQLPEFAEHYWEARITREELFSVRTLERLSFHVRGPGGWVLEWSELRMSIGSGR